MSGDAPKDSDGVASSSDAGASLIVVANGLRLLSSSGAFGGAQAKR
jgi:Cd2+/Zn2+-exporting ATPase